MSAIKTSDAASIVNVGGLTGAMGAPDRVHVVTAKAGIAGFTRGLAMELGPAQGHRQHAHSGHAGEARQAARDAVPPDLPADPRPRRMARPTLRPSRFLVGPGARYITGQTINVNGGTYFG